MSVVALVQMISDHVVAQLAEAGRVPLVDGEILLGREHQYELTSAPRIVFIPIRSAFDMKDVFNNGTETNIRRADPAFMNEKKRFEVRCWGRASDDDPKGAFDATEILYRQVLRTLYWISGGNFEVSDGQWTDGNLDGSQLIRSGREFVFEFEIGTPVEVLLTPNIMAPEGVAGRYKASMTLSDGESEVAFDNQTP